MRVFEGIWEEVAARADEFRGKRVRLIVLDMPEVPALHRKDWESFFEDLLARPSPAETFDFEMLRRENLYEERA